MTHLEILTEAYTKCGISYVVREQGGFKYLLTCNYLSIDEYKEEPLETLLQRHSFMEFNQEGLLISY